MSELKFGDLVINTAASKDNPLRGGTFVRKIIRKGKLNPGTYGQITDREGKFWEVETKYLIKTSMIGKIHLYVLNKKTDEDDLIADDNRERTRDMKDALK